MKEVELDCIGDASPAPLLRTQEKTGELDTGDLLVVHVDHHAAAENISAWASQAGHSAEVNVVSGDEWEIVIIKS